MGVGRGKRGGLAPLDFGNFSKKCCFLSFEWEKTNFTTFGPPTKILEKSLSAPSGKNPSDAHGTGCDCKLQQVMGLKFALSVVIAKFQYLLAIIIAITVSAPLWPRAVTSDRAQAIDRLVYFRDKLSSSAT